MLSFPILVLIMASVCRSVYPDPYDINAEIIMDMEVAANSSMTINLVGH